MTNNGFMTKSAFIKAELKKANVRQIDIARMLKVTPVSVHDVVVGKRNNPRIRMAISMAVGKPVDILFPPDEQKDAA